MTNLKELVPNLPIKSLGAGTTIKIDNGNYVVQATIKTDEVVVTLEYIGPGPGWAVVKIVNPNPSLLLSDLIEALQKVIDPIVQYKHKN